MRVAECIHSVVCSIGETTKKVCSRIADIAQKILMGLGQVLAGILALGVYIVFTGALMGSVLFVALSVFSALKGFFP